MADSIQNPECRIIVFDINRRETEILGYPPGNPADSFLLTYDNGRQKEYILLDAGKKGHGNNVILPYLKQAGIRRLHKVIISHWHFDHFGGLIDLLAEPDIQIDQLIYAPVLEETILRGDKSGLSSKMYREMLGLIADRDIRQTELGEDELGSVIAVDELLGFKIVSVPSRDWQTQPGELNTNDFCLVLKLKFNKFSALFTGDCGTRQAEMILDSAMAQEIRDITLLKAAHHGGDESATSEFIRQCDARLVLIPCNWLVVEERPSFINNLHEFSRNGAKIFRSDQCSDIEVVTDGYALYCTAKTRFYSEKTIYESIS